MSRTNRDLVLDVASSIHDAINTWAIHTDRYIEQKYGPLISDDVVRLTTDLRIIVREGLNAAEDADETEVE